MSKIKNIFILVGLMLLTGALNYATYPILIRYLSLEDFAMFSVFAYIIMILTIPAGGFGYFSLIHAQNHPENIRENLSEWIKRIQKYVFYYIAITAIVLAVLSYLLDIHSIASTIAIALSTGGFLVTTFFSAILQSRGRFILLGSIAVVLAAMRLSITFFIPFLPSVFVAVLTLVLPSMVGAYFFYRLGRDALMGIESSPHSEKNENHNTSLWSTFLVIALMIGLQSIDIIVVKYLFLSIDVALYAAVSVITKFSLVFISVFEMVYLPNLVDQKKSGKSLKSIIFLIVLSLLGFLLSSFLLPIIGDSVFSIIRPELMGAHQLFASLGVASVALGFFTIFLKAIIPSLREALSYMSLVLLCISLFFLADTLYVFSLYYMGSILILYVVSIIHFLIKSHKKTYIPRE